MARHGGLPAGKAIMAMQGLDCGPVRPPLKNILPDELESFREDLAKVGFPERIPSMQSNGKPISIRKNLVVK